MTTTIRTAIQRNYAKLNTSSMKEEVLFAAKVQQLEVTKKELSSTLNSCYHYKGKYFYFMHNLAAWMPVKIDLILTAFMSIFLNPILQFFKY